MSPENPRLSAVLIVKNEADKLPRCLQALQGLADEIVVIDSGSTDNTIQVAQQHGARVVVHGVGEQWPGFGCQRQFAQTQARGAWILWLDADEALTPEVVAGIRDVLDNPPSTPAVYAFNRLIHSFGQDIRHGGWFPDWVVRLHPRTLTQYNDAQVHEALIIPPGTEIKRLPGVVIHYSYRDLKHYLQKNEQYAQLWAKERHARGRTSSCLSAYLHGGWAFLRMYVLKAGFLDGRVGLMLAKLSAQAGCRKYLLLRDYAKNTASPHNPPSKPILQVNQTRTWRGGEQQTLLLMQGLRTAGEKVELLARKNSELAQKAQADGFVVHSVDSSIGVYFWLRRHAKNYAAVHVHTASALSWAALLKNRFQAPGGDKSGKPALIFTRHTCFDVPAKKEWRTRRKWQAVTQLAAVSKNAAKEPERLGIQALHIIHNAVLPPKGINPDSAQYTPDLRAQLATDASCALQARYPGKRIIATCAAICSQKDPLTQVETIAKLRQLRGDDFVFLHFGAFEALTDEVKARIAQHQLQDIYHLMGFEPEVLAYMPAFDLMCHTPYSEALGLSLIEAFWRGVPVVATDCCADVIGTDRGALAPVGDAAQLAQHINTLLNDPERRQACCHAAFNYARDAFALVNTTEQYQALYRS